MTSFFAQTSHWKITFQTQIVSLERVSYISACFTCLGRL